MAAMDSLGSVFLSPIATTFFGSSDPVYVATLGQLVTTSSIFAAAFGVLLGILNVRFKSSPVHSLPLKE